MAIAYRVMTKDHAFIAVVDDDESVCRALGRLMRSAGLQVETFSSGADFLDSLPTRRPDCLVLDLHMLGMTGFEVQAQLATIGALLPVIIITGQDSAEARGRALDGCPAGYFSKPVDGHVLLGAIESVLSRAIPSEG